MAQPSEIGMAVELMAAERGWRIKDDAVGEALVKKYVAMLGDVPDHDLPKIVAAFDRRREMPMASEMLQYWRDNFSNRWKVELKDKNNLDAYYRELRTTKHPVLVLYGTPVILHTSYMVESAQALISATHGTFAERHQGRTEMVRVEEKYGHDVEAEFWRRFTEEQEHIHNMRETRLKEKKEMDYLMRGGTEKLTVQVKAVIEEGDFKIKAWDDGQPQ